MIPKMTPDEKAQCEKARKQANIRLAAMRMELTRQIRKISMSAVRNREQLSLQRDGLNDIKGLPAHVTLEGHTLLLDYELLTRFIRKLKGRQYKVKIEGRAGGYALVIDHYRGYNSGRVELIGLPSYQAGVLLELPTIDLSN